MKPSALPGRRLRSRWFIILGGSALVTVGVVGWLCWCFLERTVIEQAQARAETLASLGSYLQTPEVRRKVQELTGYEVHILDAAAPVPLGALLLDDHLGRRLAIVYQNEDYALARRALLQTTALAMAVAVAAALLAAWWLARSIARPVESLAAVIDRIGSGDLTTPVETPASAGGTELGRLLTGLERMRLQLLRLQEDSRRDERLRTLGTFTATIAHEVRNPLSAIRMGLEVLGHASIDAAATRLISDEISKLDLIVDELVAFSGGVTVQPIACPAHHLVDQVIALLSRQARHHGVELLREGESWLQIDPRRLQQLLMNLLLNAIQALHDRGGTVRVALAADGLSVSDDGPGVDPAMQERLFEAFASDKPAGTGLGLHLARCIAEAHGARLHLHAGVGGACFVLSGIPAASPHAAGERPGPAQPSN